MKPFVMFQKNVFIFLWVIVLIVVSLMMRVGHLYILHVPMSMAQVLPPFFSMLILVMKAIKAAMLIADIPSVD